MDGATPAETAAREAFEEAGADGKPSTVCLGIYSRTENLLEGDLPCVVAVYPLKVKHMHKTYPEMDERKRKWFSRKKAAERVVSTELGQMILGFEPKLLNL